jgi:hypothetical protein
MQRPKWEKQGRKAECAHTLLLCVIELRVGAGDHILKHLGRDVVPVGGMLCDAVPALCAAVPVLGDAISVLCASPPMLCDAARGMHMLSSPAAGA